MKRVSKEFWVSDFDLEDINKNLEGDIELAKNCNIVHRNKITISYEIDREVTIKESDFEKHLQEWDLNTPSIRVTDYLKEKLFGGGESGK